ncbi:Phosphoglycerate mutase [Segniliparus rotundus DSM 44985]|uniref:Phosphoglycerate mutase n=1 Tax=Segniliparus rotundus (strain ATCC BAA-972 / CDC 1076 / CIP 108378 / DSM 44985 / JCM 13578) TaxID=640132 RepID=D6ZEV7_SEGRD|nr:histidine phosphatase family protein [Segniliparus rotundus]ADG97481.1 Phosphoglycerate mutase [Segniliparus rotundus DSM 44985]
MSERTLILLRHGQTDFNFSGRMQGHLNPELNATGREQAARSAEQLARRAPLLIVTSDLIRANQTAQALAEASGLSSRVDARLRETDLGEWEGRTPEEVEQAHPGAVRQWRSDPSYAPPGGETRLQVGARALELVNELKEQFAPWGEESQRPVVLVAHAGVIGGLTAALLGLPAAEWMQVRGLDNGAWHEMRWNPEEGRWLRVAANQSPANDPRSASADNV